MMRGAPEPLTRRGCWTTSSRIMFTSCNRERSSRQETSL